MANKDNEFFLQYMNALKRDVEINDDLFALGWKEPVNLEKIYVPLKLIRKKEDHEIPVDRDPETELKITDDRLKENGRKPGFTAAHEQVIDADRLLKDHSLLVLLGPPGAGKTTLLKYLICKTCKTNIEQGEINSAPIFISLREFSRAAKSLRGYIDDIFSRYYLPRAPKVLEKALKQGRCILFLDGFDEIIGKPNRDTAAREIHKFVREYSRCSVLATSRNTAYQNELQGFTRVELIEFDDHRINRFIDRWFEPGGREKAELLTNVVMNNKDIKNLAANPLMLTVIAIRCTGNDEPKPTRTDLYKSIIDVILDKWDAHKEIREYFSPDAKKMILRKLAFRNHSRQRRTLTEKEILEEIERCSLWSGHGINESWSLLEEIWQRSNILSRLFKDTYNFQHLSFQHYFTALELEEQAGGNDVIHLHLSDPWWEEPILLYAGLIKDAGSLIDIIHKEKPEDIFFNNLMLAGKCIAEAEYTDFFLGNGISREIWHIYNTSDFQLLREKSLDVLARLQPHDIIRELEEQLTDEDSQARSFAAETLGAIATGEVLPALMMTLAKDSESKIRSQAAFALGKISRKEALPSLIQALQTDREGEVRCSAAKALGAIGNSEALPVLFEILAVDSDSNVRGAAAEALGEIGSMAFVPQLIQALIAEKASAVRWRIALAVGKIKGADASDLFIDALINDKDKEVRESAAEGLGSIGNADAIRALIKALAYDDEADVRGSAAYALGQIKSKEALPALIRALLSDTDGEVRGRAAFALGRLKKVEALPFLIAVFNTHKESIIRGNAAYALGEIGGVDSIPFLVQALTLDKDSYVRYRAAEALGSIGDVISIAPLKAALVDEGSYYGWRVKDKAYEALEQISRRFHVRIPISENPGE